jgi:hypothetical protein
MTRSYHILKYIRPAIWVLFAGCVFSFISCKKYLDEKPRSDTAIPSSLPDLQAVLDNQSFNGSSPGYLEFVADNFYLTAQAWSGADLEVRTNYVWDVNATTPDYYNWNACYNTIYQSNFVLDLLPGITFNPSELSAYNNIKGTALFYRSFMFHQLAQLFCKPYTSSSLNDLGVVLRLTADINATVRRGTVKETYDRIIDDLKTASGILPAISLNKLRPNKAAAYAELARVYLSMNDYENAGIYADSSLRFAGELLDYNTLSAIPAFFNNTEILFLSFEGSYPSVMGNNSACLIDTNLYQQYSAHDRRRTLFFGGNGNAHYWLGSYARPYQTFLVFDGLAMDEVYLVRAECAARAGNKDGAMNDLNTLLRKRLDATFSDITAIDAADALDKVLTERRKQLLFRGLRWSDLRRFNAGGAAITLYRKVNTSTYTLPPNDLRWVLLIPNIEISRSGVPQNPR